MSQTTTIYKVYFPASRSELVLPSLNDIKLILLDNDEQLLDMLLQSRIKIMSETVQTNSKKYQTALTNKLVQVK